MNDPTLSLHDHGAAPRSSASSAAAPSRTPSGAVAAGGWFRYAAPQRFHALAGRWIPWLAAGATALAAIALYIGFGVAPTDAQQGEAYRIIFVHVPAAWMSMVIYLAMAFWAALGLIYNARLASMMACALAPTGALMTFLALWTGALWGRPTWGAWWVWDARLTSELLLLFLYIGFMALHGAIDDRRRADRAAGVLALVGVVNIPVIYFSVKWWNTLHQGASVSLTAAPRMASTMLAGMLVMALAFWLYAIAVALMRLRVIVLEREQQAHWVQALLAGPGDGLDDGRKNRGHAHAGQRRRH